MSAERKIVFREIADKFWGEVSGLNSLWFRVEAEDIVDLRFELEEDTWDNRGAVIEEILEVSRSIRDVYINFSFILPDEAYSLSRTDSADRIHAFA